MIECIQCESLIPIHYDLCPVCNAKLDRTRVYKFKHPKEETLLDRAEREIEKDTMKVEHSSYEGETD